MKVNTMTNEAWFKIHAKEIPKKFLKERKIGTGHFSPRSEAAIQEKYRAETLAHSTLFCLQKEGQKSSKTPKKVAQRCYICRLLAAFLNFMTTESICA